MKKGPIGHILVIAPASVSMAAMSVPALEGVLCGYPKVKMTILTKSFYKPIFRSLSAAEVIISDEVKYRGVVGFVRLWREVRRLGVDAVVDLSGGCRERVLSLAPALFGTRARYRRHKGEARIITRKYRKIIRPLTSPTERVCTLFEAIGLPAEAKLPIVNSGRADESSSLEILLGEKCGSWVGVSLLSPNHGTCYPIPLAAKLIELLAECHSKVVLFGVDEYERQFAEGMQSLHRNAISVAGRLTLDEQMTLLGRLDAVVCIDGDLMRLAALVGTPIVALWGATHPYIAPLFGDAVAANLQCPMACRPCSADGRRKCLFGHYKCMNSITPQDVLKAPVLNNV